MTTTDAQVLEQLVSKIIPNGKLQRAWSLAGGLSADMLAFEIEAPGGKRIKMIRRSYGQRPFAAAKPIADEFQLLQITQAVGLATPAPYYLDLSGELFAMPYYVIEYVAGQMLFAPLDLQDYLHQFAVYLVQIHNADYTDYDMSFLRKAAEKCPELGDERPSSVCSTLRETQIRQALSASTPLPQHNPSTLLHGDYWPGNSLWQDNQLTAIIDWEDAAWGDPLIDLAKSRSEIVWIFGSEAMHTFTQYYQSLSPLDNAHLAYWDLCAALRFIRIFGDNLAAAGAYFVSFGREDITERTIRQNFDYFIEQALSQLMNSNL